MSDSALTPDSANENLRANKAKPKNLSEKERKDLLERYSLEELINHFGRWPTYYLILRQTTATNPAKLVIGAGLIGAVISVASIYFRHH